MNGRLCADNRIVIGAIMTISNKHRKLGDRQRQGHFSVHSRGHIVNELAQIMAQHTLLGGALGKAY